MKARKLRILQILIFLFIAIMPVSMMMAYRYEKPIKQSFSLKTGATLHLTTLRGDIFISSHRGDKVEVEAIISADDRSELDKVNINFQTKEDSITVSTDPSATKIIAGIDYQLKVPNKLKSIQLSTRSGEIKSRGNFGYIDFKTVNGDIDFRGDFTGCKMTSANGDVDIYLRDDLSGNIFATSCNGSIEISLNSNPDFSVEGSTITGSIRSDFSTVTARKAGGINISGSVGKGTFILNLKSVNGNIKLVKK